MATLRFICSHLNDLFSQELADTQHQGEESEDNLKYHWVDELEVKQVKSIDVVDDGVYLIQGTQELSGDFSYPVSSMRIINVTLVQGGQAQFAISNQLIQSFEIIETSGGIEASVELKDQEPFSNPITGVYIANHDFPKELLSHAKD
jgi:hypothetical protein